MSILSEDALKQSILFAGDAPPAWLIESVERVGFTRGEVIYSPESFRHALGIVATGRVDVENSSGVHLNRLTEGGLFGVAAAFGEPERYISTIRAAGACEVIFISGALLERLFREEPGCSVRYIAFLTDRVRFLNAKIDGFTAPNVLEALEKWLIRAGSGERSFTVASWSGVSRALGVSRTSLYRALDTLEADGKISRDGKKVTFSEEVK